MIIRHKMERFLQWIDEANKSSVSNPGFSLLKIATNLDHGGRGLVSTGLIRANSCCLSVPTEDPRLIITPSRCVDYMNRCGCFKLSITKRALEPLDCLVLFFFHIGLRSMCPLYKIWEPYTSILPKAYSDPVYISYIRSTLIPSAFESKDVDVHFHTVLDRLIRCWCRIKNLTTDDSETPPLRFVWAWCTVNSRCVSCPLSHSACEKLLQSTHRLGLGDSIEPENFPLQVAEKGPVNVAIIPFFDFFNHKTTVNCRLVANPTNTAVELYVDQAIETEKQVFINYGLHDNLTLLLEYGFSFGTGENPCDAVYPSSTDIEYVFHKKIGNYLKDTATKLELKYTSDATGSTVWPTVCFSQSGPSPHLLILLHLLNTIQTQNVDDAQEVLSTIEWDKIYELDEDELVQQLRPLLLELLEQLMQQQQSDYLTVLNRKEVIPEEDMVAIDGIEALERFFAVRGELLKVVWSNLFDE